MKSTIKIIGILLLAFVSITLSGQETCKVLLPSLAGKYVGECSKNLADGTGEATGEDFYTGEFSKGLPDGKGKYIWKSGATYEGEWKKGMRDGNGIYITKVSGRDSILNGIWKEDKYLGAKRMDPYVIEYRNGIGRVTCMRIGDRPYVKYKFTRGGGEAYIVSNVMLQGSSGSESNNAQFTGFEEVKFPFKGKITFTAPNAFNASTISGELRLTINQPGSWLVSISF